MKRPDVSVVIPTYNRAGGLPVLLERLLDQDAATALEWDVLVVDNNSRDETRQTVERIIADDTSGRLRYAFEPRQGVSYARNTGVELTTAPIIAFLDDDGLPGRDWVRAMKEAFDEHPEAHCIGGRVKAAWRSPAPSWVTPAHAGPIALQDRPKATYVNRQNASACLLTANLGIRRSVFEQLGGFSPDYPRNQDREFEMRMWRAGMQGLYLPSMDVTVDVPAQRLTRSYHRKWQATTGHYHAMMRYRDTVDSNGAIIDEAVHARRFLGTPLFMYRLFLSHVTGWLAAAVRFRHDERFYHETRIWYYVSFFITRWRHRRSIPSECPPLRATPRQDDAAPIYIPEESNRHTPANMHAVATPGRFENA
jgi:glucosyl-dolichyl phosphate glucuronosyltransferase